MLLNESVELPQSRRFLAVGVINVSTLLELDLKQITEERGFYNFSMWVVLMYIGRQVIVKKGGHCTYSFCDEYNFITP